MQETLPAPPPLDDLLADGQVALFLDFDGTLVPIAATPDSIEVPKDLRTGLNALSHRLDGRLALVSGRAIEDIAAHLGGLDVAAAGSHGIDRRRADGSQLGAEALDFPREAERALVAHAGESGLTLERKPHGAALHYRDHPHLAERGMALAQCVADEHGLILKRGKAVIELVQPGSNKGGAVLAFMDIAPFAGAKPVFIGDDMTDEDGFEAVRKMGGIAILVGNRAPSAAHFALANTDEVQAWLGL